MSKQSQGSLSIVGAISGGVFLVSIVALMVVGGYTFSPALFLALGVAVVVSLFLLWAFHRPVTSAEPTRLTGRVPRADTEAGQRERDVPAATPAAPVAAAPSPVNGSGAGHDAETVAGHDDETVAPNDHETVAGHHGESDATHGAMSHGEGPASVPDGEPGDAHVTANESTTPAAEATETAETAQTATIGTEPQRLPEPREGGADDLKRIKGIGPKLEEQLHRMGVYHLDQIAAWSRSEVTWMDENLTEFRGRASRDDWVGQARHLSEGGETDFSQRVDDGEVYNN